MLRWERRDVYTEKEEVKERKNDIDNNDESDTIDITYFDNRNQ